MNQDALTIGAPAALPEPCGSDPPSGVRPLVRAAVTAEVAAFVRRDAPTVKAIAHRFRISADVAQDIRQDVLEAMLRIAEPIRSPRAWFWEAARRRKLRIARQHARDRRFASALDVLSHQRPPPFPSPDAPARRREHRRVVAAFLARVKPARREVAALQLLGYTETEIAQRLNLPLGTVRSRLTRAREEAKAQWAALVAALAALWLWVVSFRRRKGDGDGDGAGARSGGPRLLACAACFALPLALATHDGAERSPAAGDPLADEATAAGPSARWFTFAPILTTNAEPEREASSPGPRPVSLAAPGPARPAAPGGASARGATTAASSTPITESDREAAARHLAEVHRALSIRGDRQAARRLLDLYRLTYRQDPFPDKVAEYSALLRAP